MAAAPEPLAISSSKKKLAGFGVGSAACAAFGIKWWMVADAALVGTGVAVGSSARAVAVAATAAVACAVAVAAAVAMVWAAWSGGSAMTHSRCE